MQRINDISDFAFQTDLRLSFQEDGFIFFPSFLNRIEITSVLKQLDMFIQNKVPLMPEDMVYYEDKKDNSSLKQLQKLFEFDDFFKRMMFHSRFEYLASILLDNKVVGKNIQYFNKPPKIGKGTPAHQDGHYFMLNPDEAVTMWMALEDVDDENGCVRYVRGSHKKGMRAHGRTAVLGFSQGMTDFGTPEDLENEVYFPTKAGDLLVHHSLTIHRADENRSENRTRKAMGFIYYSDAAKEDKAAHAAYAQKLSAELAQNNKI